MQQAKSVENGLKDIRKTCRIYKSEIAKLNEKELEPCKSVRDDATEMLYDLSSVETVVEQTLEGVKKTRTAILRVLEKMDDIIATKEEEEKEKERKKRKRGDKAKGEEKEKGEKEGKGKGKGKGKATGPSAKRAKIAKKGGAKKGSKILGQKTMTLF